MNDWKPIETAPDDCGWVLVYTPSSEFYRICLQVTCRSYDDTSWLVGGEIQPTHWMPLPSAPKGSKHDNTRHNDK